MFQRLTSILDRHDRAPEGVPSSNGNGNGRFHHEIQELPLRAELFSIAQLERHAKSLAGWHRVSPTKIRLGRRPDRLIPRLKNNEAVFQEEYEQITAGLKNGRRLTPAAEWFLDNYYLIEEQIRTARRHLPKGYSHELPQLINGPSAGLPRVYDIALELISHVDGRVDTDGVRAFVASYESVSRLRLGELWAIPIMLRLALLENLRRVMLRQAASRRDSERADQWVERMLETAANEPGKIVLVLAEIVREGRPLTTSFIAEFASRLHGQGTSLVFPMSWLEQRLGEQGRTMEHVFQEASQDQAADQVSIGNSITSLRLLGATEWRDFVEAMSAVEHTLRGDPAGIYPSMDFATRDIYRHAVEKISRRSLLSEYEVAAQAIELASDQKKKLNGQAPDADRTTHVGYYLINKGRPILERAAALRSSLYDRLARFGRRFPLQLYLGGMLLIIAAATTWIIWHAQRLGMHPRELIALGILSALAVSRFASAAVQWIAALLVKPRLLPRMDYCKTEIPQSAKTIVVVPTMLTDRRAINELVAELEVRFLGNRDPSLYFALLTDLADALSERMPADADLVEQASNAIATLNAKYPTPSSSYLANGNGNGNSNGNGNDNGKLNLANHGRFYLFHRPRRWNPRQNVWMGWERKRGKLEEFSAFLRGAKGAFQTIVGPVEQLSGVEYVITLDTDTQLPRDAARLLVGTMAHPLNRPLYNEKLRRVTDGYGVLQPRVADDMPSSSRSRFAQLFTSEPGIDPYSRAISDSYQDVFQEGSYVGKGIYDVDAFLKAACHRFPENRILSHDLLEGSYVRAGLVSDVSLFESFPLAYPVDISRRHRWIRGDWQIVSWLFGPVKGASSKREANPISTLSRWKIFDNIRRSLVPLAVFALLLIGWFLTPDSLFYTLLVLGIVAIPPIMMGLEQLARRPSELPWIGRLRITGRIVLRQMLQECFFLACLPYDAYISFDAIVRTLVRLYLTRRKLLEWRTASEAQRSARTDLFGFYRSMWIQPIAALATAAGVIHLHPSEISFVGPIACLWLFAPCIAWWLSRPLTPITARLSNADRTFLGILARRTWRFFETFVTAADNYLPPDNFQEDPPQGIAHRTSPTNIGMCLLANLTAYDFGYITASHVIERTRQTLDTMDKLTRYRGHFYNWYDTRTLEPLRPAYISTVDSGNLAAHLQTLAAGLEELHADKMIAPRMFDGLCATIDILVELSAAAMAAPEYLSTAVSHDLRARLDRMKNDLRSPPRTLSAMHLQLQRMLTATQAILHSLQRREKSELTNWLDALADQCRRFDAELMFLAPWVDLAPPSEVIWRQGNTGQIMQFGSVGDLLGTLDTVVTLTELAKLEETLLPAIDQALAGQTSTTPDPARDWFKRLREAIVLGAERASEQLTSLTQLATRCREFADIEYEFLYDSGRRLLAIGYNVTDHRLDPSFYDLLASEARLASFIAIAQGKLPQEHWFSLGRPVTSLGGHPSLLSWSGSMFEYLMPLLIMPTHDHSLLNETYRGVVKRQIEYGRECNMPWGISESGYNKTDASLNYQYRAFGVPGLGYKRGLADDRVIAPYATVMALMVDPESACANLRRLALAGRMGQYGFYEAADFTPSRLPPGQSSALIRSFMAHHQGMSFLSLAYLLLDRPMQRRFASDPAFRSTELLLHERVPQTPGVDPHPGEVSAPVVSGEEPQCITRVFNTPHTPVPEVHLLSNGRYHVAVTAAGGGYSRWRDLAVTRWHEDAATDRWGAFCYVRDIDSGEFWSATHQPTLKPATSYEAIYSQGRAEFRRRDGDIECYTEVAVSPEDDIELRRVTITNRGETRRKIEFTSYAEVVLAPAAVDAAHPAFSNLFVQTQFARTPGAILCTRRPRSAEERPPYMFHLMTVQGNTAGEMSFETSRSEFIGRNRTTADPAVMHRPALSNSEGSVLDPIVAIRNVIVLEPDEIAKINIVTGVCETQPAAISLIEKYHDSHLADRVFELAWTHSQVILRQLDATEADTQVFSRLASNILYTNSLLRAPASIIARNRRGQSGLWGYGISGDLPIVLLRIGDQAQINLVRQLVAAHGYWRLKGLAVDLVIWNEDQSGYRQALQDLIMGIIGSRAETNLLDKPGGIFVRRVEQMSEEDKVLMQSVARIIISDIAGTLSEQADRRPRPLNLTPKFAPIRARKNEPLVGIEVPRLDLAEFNGIGGFTKDGREYVMTTTADRPTPAPWVNVLANQFFGTVVSDSGGAYTWSENAQSYRLTPWYNDAVGDSTGEAFYIRDEESGRFWSPTSAPARGPWPYTTRHGFGYSIFEYSDGDISSEMITYVATDAPVKFIVLKIRNNSGRRRRLSLTGFFELVLGDRRGANLPHVMTEVDPKTGAILASNPYNAEFGPRYAFLDCSEAQRTLTGDRVEFLGRNGRLSNPASMTRASLSGRVGAGLDPCAAMQVMLDLAAGQQSEVSFIFGSGRDRHDARNMIIRFRGVEAARTALSRVWDYWKTTLGAVYVQTPDASLNFLVNGWLVYQTLACRVWARTGFYQSSGAYGFRDQLQDVAALIHAEPAIIRAHLLRCAEHQFREGDVQHWWHPPIGRGVRTRISDDYLWLPFVACRYVAATGDTGVLDEKIAFIEGRPVKAEEESYLDIPARSEDINTLYDHCVRSLRHGLRFGEHGLPLMGTGDWNDGMNLVGEKGKGESVWLAFFLYDVLKQFADLATLRRDPFITDLCMTNAAKLRQSIEEHGWDGQWYTRTFFDDGQPLGSASNTECRIDSIPQSWAVLSNAAPTERSIPAMHQVDSHLVNRDLKIIQLFDPPFDKSPMNPGYVKGYVPGVRENGGQYTHAAVWTVMAFAQAGEIEKAWELFNLINPVRHGDSDAAIQKYKVEPYVMAGDIYTNPQHAGRGGWTWYTGSAGWMYRMITESLLGLRLDVNRLHVNPRIPEQWESFDIHYRYRQTFHHIHVRRVGPGSNVARVRCDGTERLDKTIPLMDDHNEHRAEVEIGGN